MITEALEAWVLHKQWSGDTSARVVFFTRDYGLVHCYYKGGRTPKKQALLQAFTPLWLTMDVRGDAYFVRQLEIAAPTVPLVGQRLFAALYMNELLYYLLKPLDPSIVMHEVYPQALETLAKATDRLAIEAVLRRFEWTLLRASGYPMSLTHEAISGKRIVDEGYYQFIVGEGFRVAAQGIRGVDILAMSKDRLEEPEVLRIAKKIMRIAIDHVLEGREIKARGLYVSQ